MTLKDAFKDRKGRLTGDILAAVVFGAVLILAGDMLFDKGQKQETENTAEAAEPADYVSELEEKTEKLLSQVEGAGNVDVMITLKSGAETVYAEENKKSTSETEENASQGDSRGILSETEESTVMTISNGDGSTSPVIIKEMTADISGIVIVAEGGDSIIVKDSLIRAAQALFDVPANKVEVFKMK
ncbi:MAG: hypothetical protein PUD43_02810 [Clostridia bacterium]|nr:hypothetical protein [Clostridia bacterium]